MAPKKSRSSVRSSVKATPEFEPLTEEEILFCWKGLVDEGKMSIPKLQKFMLQVCNVNLSTVQARDMIQYMDANGDGRVGLEDFKNFMSIGRLADTDAKNFMWTPKAQFRQEHGIGKNAKEEEGLHSVFASHSDEKRRGSTPFSDGGLNLDPSAVPAKPTTPPDAKAPGKRRPVPGRGQADSLHDAGKEGDKQMCAKKLVSDRTHTLIETAIANYEKQSWEKFLKEEKDFERSLFDQFSAGKDELEVTEYHRMLLKWFPLAEWCAPRGIRPADSLAALEYILRRDREERGIAAPEETGAGGGATVGGSSGAGASSSEAAGEVAEPVAATLPYSMWLDVLHGKHRPEEHHTAAPHYVKEAHTPW
mmetsp:Transcript_49457/g.87081  ORF Transcript_49457/g.87081 Transcript_49457/m.87081 type:complete len:363 (-) Transcript_49457:101-1189(-)